MEHACFGIFPPFCVIVAYKVDSIGDVSYRSIKPHIEHLPFGALHRHRYTPVEVTAHCTRLQTHLEPGFALPIDVRFPFLMVFQYPLLQTALPFIEREIEMSGLLQYGGVARNGRFRVYKVGGVKARSAGLALVAVCVFVSTMGASACHVTVGKELSRLLIIELHGGFLNKFSLLIQFLEEIGCCLAVGI